MEYLTYKQAALLLHVTTRTLREWVKRGVLTAPLQAGGKKLFRAQDIRASMDKLAKEAASEVG